MADKFMSSLRFGLSVYERHIVLSIYMLIITTLYKKKRIRAILSTYI